MPVHQQDFIPTFIFHWCCPGSIGRPNFLPGYVRQLYVLLNKIHYDFIFAVLRGLSLFLAEVWIVVALMFAVG